MGLARLRHNQKQLRENETMTIFSTTSKTIILSAIALVGQCVWAASAGAETISVEFRYPDQTQTVYTSTGETLENNTPIVFSSQKAMISEADAQAFAGTAPKAKTSEPTFVEGLEPRQIDAGYFVKIGSFTDMKRAIEQTETTPHAQFVKADVNGTSYYRVFVGPFTEKTAATDAQTTLIAQGLTDAYIVEAA